MDADVAIVVIVTPFLSLVGIAGGLRRRGGGAGAIFRGFGTGEPGNDADVAESG